uniref:Uncharacterized protein n=1 Tax=Sphaerodactylus townsendi TaxID=933632 RepID=A0ACB8F7J3_9SAUR
MKFFQKAAEEASHGEKRGRGCGHESSLFKKACRSCLEQAKLLFCDGKKSVARLPHDLPALKVETHLSLPEPGRGRRSHFQQRKPDPQEAEGRLTSRQSQLSDRGASGTGMWKTKSSCKPLQRGGPSGGIPSRVVEAPPLCSGSRANKASRMGGTRGRLYIKHPHLFKHWLASSSTYEATGRQDGLSAARGRDIQDLVASDAVSYRGSVDLKMEELKPFVPPPWMTVKMRKFMELLRSEGDQPPPPAEGPPDP